jgi:TetR/AcrR family transcriptional regulator, fatty acid metabolism regulator protein
MRAEKQTSQVRREQIARAAMALIAGQGMKGLSVVSVARKVGLVPSALYRHFKGKEEILGETIELVRDLLLENVRVVRQKSNRPLEQLRLLLMRHIQMVREFQAIPRIVFSEEISASHPLRKEAIYKILTEYLGRVAEIIIQGQRLGQINPALDPKTLSVLFLGVVQPPVVLWYLSNGQFEATNQAEKAWKIFKKAIQAENPKAVSLKRRPFIGLKINKEVIPCYRSVPS